VLLVFLRLCAACQSTGPLFGYRERKIVSPGGCASFAKRRLRHRRAATSIGRRNKEDPHRSPRRCDTPARYVMVFTTVPANRLSVAEVGHLTGAEPPGSAKVPTAIVL
jgi:hypothetical protein